MFVKRAHGIPNILYNVIVMLCVFGTKLSEHSQLGRGSISNSRKSCLYIKCVIHLLLYRNSRKGTADNWPSETTRENEEKKKAEAMVFCRSRSLNVQQRRLCYKFPIQVAAVFRGFREAAQECQHQFRNERWNCSFHISMPNDQAIQPLMMKLLSRGIV